MNAGGDLRYAGRRLRNAPGFTCIAITTLALGMGATTAIFSVVDAVLLRPLPFRDSDRLLALWEKDPALNRDRNYVAPVNYLAWQKQSHTVETMAAIQDVRGNISGGSGEPEEVKTERFTAALLPMLGVQPMLGRSFRDEEYQPGRNTVALIGERLWRRRFGADRAVSGKPLRVRDHVYTIVGVMPAGFSVLEPDVEVWTPLVLDPADRSSNGRYLSVVGRMRAGMKLADVRREMQAIGDDCERALPAVDTGWRPSVYGLLDELVFDVRRGLWVLMGACGLLLLMACANVANLLLVRGSARRREIGLRTALGATRSRLIAHLLSESVLLSFGGAALGLALAAAAIFAVVRTAPADVPRLGQVAINLRLFAFTFAAAAISGIVSGIVPALTAVRTDLTTVMNEGGRSGTSGATGRWLRQTLSSVQIAIALVVLIAGGLLVRSLMRLYSANPGFDPTNLLTLRVPLAGGHNAGDKRAAFTQDIVDAVSVLPGVVSVGAVSGLPLAGLGNGADFFAEGRSGPPPIRHPNGLIRSVTPDYFRTMRIPLVEGRWFTAADGPDAPMVVVINRTLARQFFPNTSAIGGRLVIDNGVTRKAEIVGVVGDVKPERFEGETWPLIYHANAQAPANGVNLVVRTQGPPLSLANAVRDVIGRRDPEQVITDVAPMQSIVDRAIAGTRFNAVLLATFAGIAVVLATVGIYGVISYDVGERTNEIGIRTALGAGPGQVLWLVLSQAARVAAGGLLLGIAAAWWLTRLMASMLFGVAPNDVGTFAAISIGLAAVALAAGYLPSRRAMRLDPLAALRHE